jgi:hypothetical protein
MSLWRRIKKSLFGRDPERRNPDRGHDWSRYSTAKLRIYLKEARGYARKRIPGYARTAREIASELRRRRR